MLFYTAPHRYYFVKILLPHKLAAMQQISIQEIQNFKGKYPKQLYLLFFTEMWERFTFYGMRTLLVAYMISALHFGESKAYMIYGTQQSLIYAMMIFGGLLADKILGFRKSILWGGILMVFGSFMLAFKGEAFFYAGLATVVVGNTFFKPNISTIVGNLYANNDGRRDAGFSLFYMGINLGSILGGLLCGYVGETISWNLGFAIAGVFMIVGLVVFARGQKMLGPIGLPPLQPATPKPSWITRKDAFIFITSICFIPLFVYLLNHFSYYNYVLNVLMIGSYSYALFVGWQKGKEAFMKMIAALVLISFSILFWAFYEQGGGSLNLFTLRNVNLLFMGMHLSGLALNNSINGIMIVTLSPLFGLIWIWLARSKREPNAAVKFALGLAQLGFGFYLLSYGAHFANSEGRIPLLIYALGYLFMSTGELCLSPIGLSVITRLAPTNIVGFMMGVWFLASAYGQYLAGYISSLMSIPDESAGANVSSLQTLSIYADGYGKIAVISVISGIVLLALSFWLKKCMEDKK